MMPDPTERAIRAQHLRRFIAETERLASLMRPDNADGRAAILAKRDAYAQQLVECCA